MHMYMREKKEMRQRQRPLSLQTPELKVLVELMVVIE